MVDNYAATPGLGLLFASVDVNGTQYPVLIPYAKPADFINGVTADMVDNLPHEVIGAQGLLLRAYATHILVTNSDAIVGTFVNITDGSGGTVLYTGYAAEGGGGFSITLPNPIHTGLNTGLYAQCESAGANVRVSASGFKSI